ncbi:MAG: anti-sigma factor family protein [Myxococcota bacterium]
MLSCDQVARELSDALDRELPVWRRLQIHAHLAMCKACRGMARSLERTVDLLHELRDEPPAVDEPGASGGGSEA